VLGDKSLNGQLDGEINAFGVQAFLNIIQEARLGPARVVIQKSGKASGDIVCQRSADATCLMHNI
jgi:hypothetical protein